MEQKKEVLTVGICAVVLALVLRLTVTAPVQNETFFSLLVYLQTGRLVRYSQSEPVATVPPTAPPTLEVEKPASGLHFTREDGARVTFYDFTASNPDIPALLTAALDWTLTGEEPTVLILHTHATESYTRRAGEIYEESSAYRTYNASYNLLSVGEELARVLESGGIRVLHDQTLHDWPNYSGAYDASRETALAYLQKYVNTLF